MALEKLPAKSVKCKAIDARVPKTVPIICGELSYLWVPCILFAFQGISLVWSREPCPPDPPGLAKRGASWRTEGSGWYGANMKNRTLIIKLIVKARNGLRGKILSLGHLNLWRPFQMEAQQNGAFSVLDLRNQERRSTNEEGEYFLGQLILLGSPWDSVLPESALPFPPVGHSLVAIQYQTLKLHTMTYHTIPYHDIPYHTIPYRTTSNYTTASFTEYIRVMNFPNFPQTKFKLGSVAWSRVSLVWCWMCGNLDTSTSGTTFTAWQKTAKTGKVICLQCI